MKNIFITGDIRIGKSTVIKKVLDLLKDNYGNNLNIGGYKCCRNIIIKNALQNMNFF